MNTYRRLLPYGLFLLMFVLSGHVLKAQDAQPAASQDSDGSKANPNVENPNPLKRRITDKQRIEQQKALTNELHGIYKKWVDEDVRWIITDQELRAFKALSNDEERDTFIENFWQRRNPNPESEDNEYKDAYYERIQYANEHFAAGMPGWKTDRGQMWIKYGKPDNLDSHPSGGAYHRPMEEGGGDTAAYPFEIWNYRYLEGIGDNVDIEFVDPCMCGEYHMTIDRSEKDALKHTPGMGQTFWEANGQAKPEDRLNGSGLEQLGLGPMASMNQSKEFDRLERFAELGAPPPIKFKDLEEYMVNSKIITGPLFNFDVRTDWVKVTNSTVLVPLTIQIRNKDITYTTKDGVSTGKVEIQGQVSNITHKPIQSFGDIVPVSVASELLARTQNNMSVYRKSLPLAPGQYRVDIVIKDVNNPDHIGRWRSSINVPKYDDDQLASSSLILASEINTVPRKDIGQGNFVIGDTHIVPRVPTGGASVPVTYHRSQNLDFWMQVYNLGIDEKSRQNNATIEYQITDMATNKPILHLEENSNTVNKTSDQVTLQKQVALASFQPGKYELTIKVNDGVSKQQLPPISKPFVVD